MDQKSNVIVNIDNFMIASNVIKSLRSSSNSARCYKQNASRDDYIINDLEQFNKIVNHKIEENNTIENLQKEMNEKITLYQPLSSINNNYNNNRIEQNAINSLQNGNNHYEDQDESEVEVYSSDDDYIKVCFDLINYLIFIM